MQKYCIPFFTPAGQPKMMYENFMRFWLSLIFVVRLKRMKFLCFYQIKHVRYSYIR